MSMGKWERNLHQPVPMDTPVGTTHRWENTFYKLNPRGMWFVYRDDDWYRCNPDERAINKSIKEL